MPDAKHPLKVFLCHAHADKAQARDLYRTLKRRGLQPWLDAEDLLPGQTWQVEIPKALETSDAIIILLSKTSVDKEGYVQKEIKFALDKALEMPEGRIFVIPTRLDECEVPRSISGYHWVDLFDDGGYDKLMKALKLRAEQLERVNVKAFTKYKPEPEFEKTPLGLLKREIRLKTSNLEKILDFLQNRLQKIYPAEKSRVVELNNFPDGIKRTITHTYSLSLPYRGQNKLVMQCTPSMTTFPGEFDTNAGETQEFHTYNAIVFTGWETQTVFLELEYNQKWQIEIDALVEELYNLFGQYGNESVNKSQVVQPMPEEPVETKSEVVPEKEEPEKPVPPPPVEPKTDQNPPRKLKPEYIVAIIGAVATILAALIGILPQIIKPAPVKTSTLSVATAGTIRVTQASLATLTLFASKTAKPSLTPTKILTITPTSLPIEITDVKGITMRLIPAGEFIMGSDNGENDEKPVQHINLIDFYIDKYEVTNALYVDCVDVDACQPPKDSTFYDLSKYANHPVVYIDWYMAKDYCAWRGARLPTEAEWEKAARGSDGRTYPWGETVDCSYANYRVSNILSCVGKTTEVGSYERGKSIFGVYDMAGNVTEWVSSLHMNYPYDKNDGRENIYAPGARILRGGSWNNYGMLVRTADRAWRFPSEAFLDYGFRCARDARP